MKLNGLRARRPYAVNQKGGAVLSRKDKNKNTERRTARAELKRWEDR